MKYELSKHLKISIENEMETNIGFNRMVVFKEIAKQVFPNLKNSALMIGNNIELTSYD